ncbi:MAG: class I SAM-dependent methyltransferase [Nitrososphaera sp.]
MNKDHYDPIPAWLSFTLNNPYRRRFDKGPEMVAGALRISDPSVVLDFGCGPGFYTVPFARVAKQVIAVDLQDKMLEKAIKYAEKSGVKDKIRFLHTDGKRIPELQSGVCDFAFLGHVYHEIEHSARKDVLLDLWRVLKPGGRMAIMEHTKNAVMGPPAVNLEELKAGLEHANFAEIEVIDVSKDTGLIVAIKKSNNEGAP